MSTHWSDSHNRQPAEQHRILAMYKKILGRHSVIRGILSEWAGRLGSKKLLEQEIIPGD